MWVMASSRLAPSVCTPCPRTVSKLGVVGRSYGSRSRWIWYIAQHHAVLLDRELAGHVRSRRLPRPDLRLRRQAALVRGAAEIHIRQRVVQDQRRGSGETPSADHGRHGPAAVRHCDGEARCSGHRWRRLPPGDRRLLWRQHPQCAGTTSWYLQDQRKRMEEKHERFYPCHAGLGTYIAAGLTDRGFDITAMKSLKGEQFEGHAYSFIHRRFMSDGPIPIVPIMLNTYYPPNQPSPTRCFDLGTAIRGLVDDFPDDLRVGIMASGGLSHFLVNEELDHEVIEALQRKDHAALKALPAKKLLSGSSEIRNWIAVAAAVEDLKLDWISYVPGYRSRALTGVGLCFAHWH